MNTLILATVLRVLVPLLLGFSVYMFIRGHHQPGGGFIAGLLASFPFLLHAVAFGEKKTRQKFRIKPALIVVIGLLIASFSGIFALVKGLPYMTRMEAATEFPLIGQPGTAFLFDMGIYFTVFGVVLKIGFLLAED